MSTRQQGKQHVKPAGVRRSARKRHMETEEWQEVKVSELAEPRPAKFDEIHPLSSANKKRRSSAARPPPPPACDYIMHLLSDCNYLHRSSAESLFPFLDWWELANLQTTCKRWQGCSVTVQRPLRCILERLPLFINSSCLLRSVSSIQLNISTRAAAELLTNGNDKPPHELLRMFQNLRSLEITAPDKVLEYDFLQPIGSLPLLHTLILSYVYKDSSFETLSFKPLSQCPNLSTFIMQDQYGNSDFTCTSMQAFDVSDCRSLTALQCGIWCDPNYEGGPALELPFLVQLPLQELVLTKDIVYQVHWEILSNFPALKTLTPNNWGSDIGRSWEHLSKLRNLTTFSYTPYVVNETENRYFMDALIQASSITHLTLAYVKFNDQDLSQLFSNLRHLTVLHLERKVTLETCAPFALATSLEELELHNVSSWTTPSKYFYYHSCLPAMPNLRTLSMSDKWYVELCLKTWPGHLSISKEILQEMFNAFRFMLHTRMPKLAMKNIQYDTGGLYRYG